MRRLRRDIAAIGTGALAVYALPASAGDEDAPEAECRMNLNLPTLAEVSATRRATPKGAEPTRLQKKTADAKDERKEEAAWKRAVWIRDGGTCRWCHRVCRKCLDLAPDRGEVHHVSGRVVRAIRWDRRNGVLLCKSCHERVTGRVAEKFLMHSRHTFSVDGIAYLNADKSLSFKRVA